MFLRVIKILWVLFFLSFFAIWGWIAAVGDNWGGLFGGMPDFKELDNPQNALASVVYAADGEVLGSYFRENRQRTPYDSLSPHLINALIATEDVRFESHSGIDLRSLMRVAVGILTFDLQGGGSTISQQLAKNLFQTRGNKAYEGTLTKKESNKILRMAAIKTKEWILAVRLERSYTKKEIIEMYLNTVDFGRNYFGINTAATKYFGRTPKDLDLHQAAVLVGMLKGPSLYNPISHPKNAINRRNVVFQQLQVAKFISPTQKDSLRNLPLDARQITEDDEHNRGLATYFRTVLRNELLRWCQEKGYDLFADGLKIYTTIDSRLQKMAEKAALEHMKELQQNFEKQVKGIEPWRNVPNYLVREAKKTERYRLLRETFGDDSAAIFKEFEKPTRMRVFSWNAPNYTLDTVMTPMDSIRYMKMFLHIGMVALEAQTGRVKAWVGGINHTHFKFDHVKQGPRQPGSTFKPIVYAAAIKEKKFTPCHAVVDVPTTVVDRQTGQAWTPRSNFTGESMTLRQALGRSVNSIAAYLIKEISPEKAVEYAKNMGVESKLDPTPSIALGTSDVSVLELTGAYSTFLNNGYWVEPTFIVRIEDRNGNVVGEFTPVKREVFKPEEAYTMLYMLRGAIEERGGTAGGLWRYDFKKKVHEVGGKTGTTQKASDGWFIAVLPALTVGTWVGGDDKAITFPNSVYAQGSRLAMPAFAKFMDSLYADSLLVKELGYDKYRFERPFPEIDRNFDCAKQKLQIDSTRQYIPNRPDDIM